MFVRNYYVYRGRIDYADESCTQLSSMRSEITRRLELSHKSRPTLMPDAGVPTKVNWRRHDRTQGELRNAILVPAGEMVAPSIKRRDNMSLGGNAQRR